MNKLIAVIRREYLARVRSGWFIISTLLAPVLLVGVMLIPILLTVRQAERAVEIAVLDETGLVGLELSETDAVAEGRLRLRPLPRGSGLATREALLQQVQADELSGYLYIPSDVLEVGRVEYWGRDVGQSLVRATLRPAATAAVRRVQARALGLDPAAAGKLTQDVAVDAFRVTEKGIEREDEARVIAAHVLGILIYFVVLLYGAMMLRAAVAEKASKTIEIILSSLRPWQLMLGKTLGVGAVGLTQIAVWLGIAAIFLIYAATSQAFAEADFLDQLPLGWDLFALFIGLFISGYFLYSGMYAAVGAIASSEQEASQLQIPVTLVLVVPILVIPVVLESPGSDASLLLSWIPFFTPVLFIVRFVLGAVSGWEVPVVFVLQLLAILLVAWVGGRIYRVGLLMTGKRPTLPELVRWIRHG